MACRKLYPKFSKMSRLGSFAFSPRQKADIVIMHLVEVDTLAMTWAPLRNTLLNRVYISEARFCCCSHPFLERSPVRSFTWGYMMSNFSLNCFPVEVRSPRVSARVNTSLSELYMSLCQA